MSVVDGELTVSDANSVNEKYDVEFVAVVVVAAAAAEIDANMSAADANMCATDCAVVTVIW